MGQIIIPNAVVRKPGFMYFINKNGDICEARMAYLNRREKKENKESKDKK